MTTPTEALDTALRDEWGRLLALLVARYRRLDLAEDGLADAFEAAARTWPADGVPTNPGAWLLVAARRRITDRLRAEAVANRKLPLLAVEADLTEEAQRTMADPGEHGGVADERLRLVLLCAHPALPPEAAAALTLRLVLGVSTEDLARLFLVRTSTMAARLTRARKRLAGESFAVPVGAELADRRPGRLRRGLPRLHRRLRARLRLGRAPRRRRRRGDPAGPGPARPAARAGRQRWTRCSP